MSDVNIPSNTISGSSSKSAGLKIFPRTVSVTLAPRNMAPLNSNMEAMTTACLSVMDLEETDVATFGVVEHDTARISNVRVC